jgi:hypothetical protein
LGKRTSQLDRPNSDCVSDRRPPAPHKANFARTIEARECDFALKHFTVAAERRSDLNC